MLNQITTKNIFIYLILALISAGCKRSGIDGYIVNNSNDTLIVMGLNARDTLLLPQNNIPIYYHPFHEWISHKSNCCQCDLVSADDFIKPINKTKKLTKNIRDEAEWKKSKAKLHSSLNCQFIITQNDITN